MRDEWDERDNKWDDKWDKLSIYFQKQTSKISGGGGMKNDNRQLYFIKWDQSTSINKWDKHIRWVDQLMR